MYAGSGSKSFLYTTTLHHLITHFLWSPTNHSSCDVSGNRDPEVPRKQSLGVLDGLSEGPSVCILCDEDKDLALLVEDPNELEYVWMVQTLQQLDLQRRVGSAYILQCMYDGKGNMYMNTLQSYTTVRYVTSCRNDILVSSVTLAISFITISCPVYRCRT